MLLLFCQAKLFSLFFENINMSWPIQINNHWFALSIKQISEYILSFIILSAPNLTKYWSGLLLT